MTVGERNTSYFIQECTAWLLYFSYCQLVTGSPIKIFLRILDLCECLHSYLLFYSMLICINLVYAESMRNLKLTYHYTNF